MQGIWTVNKDGELLSADRMTKATPAGGANEVNLRLQEPTGDEGDGSGWRGGPFRFCVPLIGSICASAVAKRESL